MGKQHRSETTSEYAPAPECAPQAWSPDPLLASVGLGSDSLEEARAAMTAANGPSDRTAELLDQVDGAREAALETPQWAAAVFDSPAVAPKSTPWLPPATDAVNPSPVHRPSEIVSLPPGAEPTSIGSPGLREGLNTLALINGFMEMALGAGRLADGDYRGAYDVGQGAADSTGAMAEFMTPLGQSSKVVPGAQMVSGGFDIASGFDQTWSADDTQGQAEGLTDVAKGTTAVAGGAGALLGYANAPVFAAGVAGLEVGKKIASSAQDYSRERDYFGENRTYSEWGGDKYREWSSDVDDFLGTEHAGEALAFLPALVAGTGAGFYAWGRGVGEDVGDMFSGGDTPLVTPEMLATSREHRTARRAEPPPAREAAAFDPDLFAAQAAMLNTHLTVSTLAAAHAPEGQP